MELTVKASNGAYNITVENGLLLRAGSEIKRVVGDATLFLVADQTAYAHHGKRLQNELAAANVRYKTLLLPPGEPTKCEAWLFRILSAFAAAKLSRKDYVAAFGGGVCGDITAFAASIYLRGVKYIGIPTTLLSQVDSSVGGKTAIDLPEGKNLVGSFYAPCRVLIDPLLLGTLPKEEFACGMAEVIKYGAIYDAKLFGRLLKEDVRKQLDEVIFCCVDLKRQAVEADEFDTGKRMLLNFGHTYGHVLERYCNYQTYSHGQAVAAGMARITRVTEAMGRTAPGTLDALLAVLKKYGLPDDTGGCAVPRAEGEPILALDKKSGTNTISYVILEKIGKAALLKLPKEENLLWKL